MSSVDLHQEPLGDAHLEQVLQVGRVAAGLVGEARRLRRLEPGLLVRRDDLVLELAQVGAELRLEVGPGDAPQVADQLLRCDQPIDARRGPGRRRRRSRAATAPSAGRAWSSAGTARAAGRARRGCAPPVRRPCRACSSSLPVPADGQLDQLARRRRAARSARRPGPGRRRRRGRGRPA